jgi:ubiquinone/menaquinone biosynthesis C-methylase UbiE
VERFYSTGRQIRRFKFHTVKKRTEEFLSFGFWKKGTRTYVEAADNLLDFFIGQSGIVHTQKILNVACGYGTETFAYHEAFQPESIEAVDVTEKHVRYANLKAETLRLAHKIRFHHGDACDIPFNDSVFSAVLAIEGPVHFNSREKFFQCACRVLRRDGDMVLTDIILGRRYHQCGWLKKKIMAFTVKWWVVPKENWVDQRTYGTHLENAGFSVLQLQPIGDRVFPGYAKNAFSLKTVRIRFRQRGLWAAAGLTIISYLLGYLYARGLIEYIFVRSRKA